GSGPFAAPTIHESLILLQIFMGVVAITTLVLVAVTTERERAKEAAPVCGPSAPGGVGGPAGAGRLPGEGHHSRRHHHFLPVGTFSGRPDRFGQSARV